jgi:hypothetical protein
VDGSLGQRYAKAAVVAVVEVVGECFGGQNIVQKANSSPPQLQIMSR